MGKARREKTVHQKIELASMQPLFRTLIITLSLLAALYLLICLFLYLKQEQIIFYPSTLSRGYEFRFKVPFEEHYLQTPDGTQLHGLLFKAEASQGLVFFLHGNAGALDSWGELAAVYTQMNYDVFMLDYRGYGKSGGKIEGQEQLFADVQLAYNYWRERYPEQQIVLVGFSIGSGPAAMLAGRNQPKMLLLLAPYYSLTDMLHHSFPYVPSFLLKYKFQNHRFLDQTQAPVYLFHGTHDEVIPFTSSIKLEKHLKLGDRLVSLEGQDHNGIHGNPKFLFTLMQLLRPSPTT